MAALRWSGHDSPRAGAPARLTKPASWACCGWAQGARRRAPSSEDPSDLAPYRSGCAEIALTDGIVLVAERSGEVVGVCQLIVFRHFQSQGGRCAEIEGSVHVHPDHRGAGVGAHSSAKRSNGHVSMGAYGSAHLNTAPRRSLRFYERFGLSPTHAGFKMPLE